jgi:hypothetical protein
MSTHDNQPTNTAGKNARKKKKWKVPAVYFIRSPDYSPLATCSKVRV